MLFDRLTYLSTCSQTLRDEAERRIYGKLSASQPREVALLCELLAREPRLAGLVGELTIVTTDVPRVELDEVGVVALIHGSPYESETPLEKWTDADFHAPLGALRYV